MQCRPECGERNGIRHVPVIEKTSLDEMDLE